MASKRGAYQRRGRFALLGAAGVFVVAQLATGLLLDWRGVSVRFPSLAHVLNVAPRGNRGPDVVFLGTSRSQGLHADEATALLRMEHPESGPIEVCNAAVPGGDPIAEDYVLEHLISQGSRPRLAVVEVSPDTVNNYNECFALHCHRQICWWDVPRYFLDICRAGELKKLAASRLVPLYAHRREILHQSAVVATGVFAPPSEAKLRPPIDLGISTSEQAPPPLSAAEVETCQGYEELSRKRFRDYLPGGSTAEALERLLRRCRDNDIDVILYSAPCTSFFRTNFTPEIDASYSAYIERLTQTYGCRFINYRDALPDQCFADMLHYNPSGGRIFTCRLTREVISPWLGRKQAGYAQR
jgi:hypothetical protein